MASFCNNCGKGNRDSSTYCAHCGKYTGNSCMRTALSAGAVIENRYRIIKPLKAGGMGSVYCVMDQQQKRICALKELYFSGTTREEFNRAREWFFREASLLSRLSHPGLPKVFDYFYSQGNYYLVMTFIEGEDLETLLKGQRPPGFSEEKVVEWAEQLLDILDYLHSQNPPVIYRDIKPANIMIRKNGQVMLIDFGIARTVQPGVKGTATGSPGYAPPEQYRGECDNKSDIYSLGATMHHLLTGIEPIPFQIPPLRTVNQHISSEMEHIVIKTLKFDKSQRFSSAAEMKDALVKFSASSLQKKPPVSLPQRKVQIYPPVNQLPQQASASEYQKIKKEPVFIFMSIGSILFFLYFILTPLILYILR